MPRVTIEFDLPEGQAMPKPEDIVRLTSHDWIADYWHISDVENCDWSGLDITDKDCREILRRVLKYKDANEGINWEVLQSHIDSYIAEKEVTK